MSIQGELSVLYYPYARTDNIDNMRKAILVFDHVYFIRPVNYSRRSEDNAPMSNVNAPMPMNKSMSQRSVRQQSSSDDDPFYNKIFKAINPTVK